jgi:hypothetical protein
MKTFLLAALIALLPACGKKSSAPPAEPENTTGTGDEPVGEPPAEEPAPTTAEECEAAGYQVVGDIGDGNVQCRPAPRRCRGSTTGSRAGSAARRPKARSEPG